MKTKGRLFITGDTHSTYDIDKLKQKNWSEGYNLSKKDVLVIAGDFGFLWHRHRTKSEAYWLKWLDDRPWSTCFVDGNHENFYLLDKLPKYYLFGSEVGIVGHSIHHLLRGNIYRINQRRVLAIGGANSHDREHRTWEETMWKQEVITQDDIDNAFHNLAIYHNKVDYVVSHCAPTKFAMQAIPLSYAPFWSPDQSEEMLSQLLDQFEYKKWFFGHYHDDVVDSYDNKWTCCYNKIHEVE